MKLKKLSKIKLHSMVTVYGASGSGKTSLINSLKDGNTLVIDTDKGLASVDSSMANVSVAECETFEDVLEAFELAKDFDNIAIDHLTNVQELCYKYVLEQNNAKKMLINHYGEASQLLKGLVDDLVALAYQGKQVLVLCQEKNINIEEGVNDDVPQQTVPNLMDSVRSYLVASSRVVGHSERITKSKFVKGERKVKDFYQVRLAGNPIYTLKVTRKPGTVIPDTLESPTVKALTDLTKGIVPKKETKESTEKEEETK